MSDPASDHPAGPEESAPGAAPQVGGSPSGNPAQLDEMFGFAESTPIQITDPVIESN